MSHGADAKVIEVTDANFQQEVLDSAVPFLLDLSAEWCGPCRALAPTIAELAKAYDGKARFGTIDIDANPSVPARYQVRSIPTMIMFQGGEVVGQLIGAHPKARVEELVKKAL